MLLPAIKPDVALLHAPMADRFGNVWIGRQRELATMAHAAEKTVVTVEKIIDGNLLDDPVLAAGTLPGFYVESDRGRRTRRLAAALCPITTPPTPSIWRCMRRWRRRRRVREYLDKYVYENRRRELLTSPLREHRYGSDRQPSHPPQAAATRAA